MRLLLNLPKIIAIPLILVILTACVILSSVFFVLLLIPVAIGGFSIWRRLKLVERARDEHVIDSEFTVIEKRQDDL